MIESPLPQREIITISPIYRWLTIGFAVCSILVTGFILSSTFGQATIFIKPKFEEKNVQFSLPVYKSEQEADKQAPGVIAEILEANLEKDIVVKLTQAQATTTRAQGIVTIINKSTRQQTLVANTQLMAENDKIYRLTKSIVSNPGQSIDVEVRADEDGEGYDIGKSNLLIVKLRPDLQTQIYGETKEINRLQNTKTEVNEQSINTALDEAKKILADELIIQLKALKPINEKTISVSFYRQNFDNKKVSPGGEITFTLGAIAKALTLSEENIASAVSQTLPESYKQGLSIIDQKNLSYAVSYTTTIEGKNIALINGDLKVNVADIKINKNILLNKTPEQAENLLKELGAEEVEINLPFWQKHLPKFSNNITLELYK